MELKSAQYLANLMENAGEECEVRESYSGRGMYGKSTAGIVIDSELILISVILDHMREIEADEEIPEVERLRHDNMGTSVIIY